ncbi:hypothetical protein [Tepidibacter formicigenes]|jgi:hypothetical protein|uniref:Uncharacterized protein n=1 Tax=Tepidibacter formicigenes DSM 15518 TaxID=1123349 RepID=A0A1M6U4M8_9FIRM|nr:hypothetical protein [Tepidibacter formicigenes]SHK64120.1 hypothetical protein SAMN02744037_02732 [Tepidibacter formicigenes DSM 15518]
MNIKTVKVIRRDKQFSKLDELMKKYDIRKEEVLNLYNLLASKSKFEIEDWLLLNFRRVITAYQPEFINQFLEDREINTLYVVESLSQNKAIKQAMNIDSRVTPKIYIDMPSKSGKNRMHRSENGAIYIFDDVRNETYNKEFVQYIEQINFEHFFKKFEVNNFMDLVIALREGWSEIEE